MTIHWIGTGLSAIPGLRRLLRTGAPVTVWNRTEARAREAVGDLAGDIRCYSFTALEDAVGPGDIIVSMLPADQHLALARMAIGKGAHFVSSSYIAPEMAALDQAALGIIRKAAPFPRPPAGARRNFSIQIKGR